MTSAPAPQSMLAAPATPAAALAVINIPVVPAVPSPWLAVVFQGLQRLDGARG